MSKILVTGGAGFIGSHLVDALIARNHKVIVVDNLSTGKKKFIHPEAKFYKLSILNPKLKKIFSREKPEYVFHLAAQKSVPFSLQNPLADATDNIWGSLKLIESSLANKVKKFVFISTAGALYSDSRYLPFKETSPAEPLAPYGLSKLAIDNYLRLFYGPVKKLDFCTLRLANIYGPRQDPYGEAGVIAIFVYNLLKNKQCFINGHGRQTRDYLYVSDIVDGMIKAMTRGSGVYNLGTGKETSVNDLYHLIAGLISGKEAKHRPSIAGEIMRNCINSRLAGKELGWKPKVDLASGVKKTIVYFK